MEIQIKVKNNYNGALQQPLQSVFNSTSTAQDVIKGIDLSGKTVIVTGGYAGIGLETVKVLVAAGAKVIVPSREIQKAANNLKGLEQVTVDEMNLMDPDSIDAFATRFLAAHDALHILVNNACIMWVPLQRDKQGYESQLSTNHLGHFQLVARLWPTLKNAGGARVVNVSSYGHQITPFNFEDPNFNNREYETLQGYGQSKTANNLFCCRAGQPGQGFKCKFFFPAPRKD